MERGIPGQVLPRPAAHAEEHSLSSWRGTVGLDGLPVARPHASASGRLQSQGTAIRARGDEDGLEGDSRLLRGGCTVSRGLLLLWLLLCAPVARAELRLPLMFSDGAVLQRDRVLPVWGWAAPGAKIEVELDGRRATTTAAAD